MKQYTIKQQVMISEIQKKTLIKLESKYGVNVSQFIRSAIAEKLQHDWPMLQEKLNKKECPF